VKPSAAHKIEMAVIFLKEARELLHEQFRDEDFGKFCPRIVLMEEELKRIKRTLEGK